ncbi:MAG: pilus assembly protein TadG-related protein [Pseudomonadota bacterium]
MKPAHSSISARFVKRRQQGQALIYGIFVLMGGLAALMFLFNTGQLTAEKTKLVNTADAVAYSAAVMHARALNFDAYTNRALMANEVIIAQAVSIASWSAHVVKHTQNVPPLSCYTYYSVPVVLALTEYIPVCYLLSLYGADVTADSVDNAVQVAAQATVIASEIAKGILQAAQANMAATLLIERKVLMQQVADANYAGDGAVHVDTIPITDNFSLFDGETFIHAYSGADRARFKDAVVEAANRDAFVKQRSWTSANGFACILGNKAAFRRRGGTELIDFDEWKAMDTASLHRWTWHTHGIFHLPTCDDSETALGYGTQAAANGSPDDTAAGYGNSRADNPDASAAASSTDWGYGGLPTFYDLSASALAYTSTDPNPRLKFAIRLTRARNQLNTSDAASGVKPTGRLAIIDGKLVSDVLAAVATSEVYFERPAGSAGSRTELASLFNPYWQAHLISTSTAYMATAMALGGPR